MKLIIKDLISSLSQVFTNNTSPTLDQSSNTLTTKPDLGLGSNQVDFGGIFSPALATYII